MVGVSKEGASSLTKVFQWDWTCSLTWFMGAGTRQVVPSNQVVTLDLPLVVDVIHHDVAVLKVPTRRKVSVLTGQVNLHFLGKGCIINRFVAIW